MNEKNISIRIPSITEQLPASGVSIMGDEMGRMALQGLHRRIETTDSMTLIERAKAAYHFALDRPFDPSFMEPKQPRHVQQPMSAPAPGKLRAEQLAKERCQTIAKMLWKQNPNITIAELTRHPMIRDKELGGGQFYEPRTVYDWIAEIKNHPQKNKRGRPRKSLK